MSTIDLSKTDEQQIDFNRNVLQLDDYLSLYRTHGHEIYFLNLDRCLRQPFIINDSSNTEAIGGISLTHNCIIQMPVFVSNYGNLIELNASFNELSNVDFILYGPLNENELTELNWDEKPKANSYNSISQKTYNVQEINCPINRQATDMEHAKALSTKNSNCQNHLKSPAYLPNKQIFRSITHPFLENINLSFNHIKCLPTNIHYLRFLCTLELSHNYLKALPANIGYLEQLTTLKLDYNYLKTLPNTFSRLIRLQSLNLSHNYFQSIDGIKNFPNLKYFSINSNPLVKFPSLLYTCSNLEDLSFSSTQLNKMNNITLETFNQFSKLKKLDLSKNSLNNEFLSSSAKSFDCLEELNLQNNQFTNIFSLLSTMKSLYLLDLSFNSLTNIPECLNANLKTLRLSYNNIELQSKDCTYLKHIITLELDHNQVKQLPNEFIQCLHLKSLNISFNQFMKFPDIILRLRSLNKLIFNNSKLKFLTSIDLLKEYFYRTLNMLDLSNNNLHTNLNELTILKALTYLDLSYNQLYELDEDFKFLTCLKILKLHNNKFSNCPPWLYETSKNGDQKYVAESLVELHINNNQIKLLSENIIHMIRLQTIDLSNNQFLAFPDILVCLAQLSSLIYSQEHGIYIDKLPDDFSHLYNLRRLDLSHNIFTEIPLVIYDLSKLEYLNMSYNLLRGIEKNRLKQLKNFKTLRLNGNKFRSFPSSLYYQLETFNINDNSLCLAPPSDFLEDEYISAVSNLFVQINDRYEEKLFQIYQRILVENLTSHDIQPLSRRLKISENDLSHFGNAYHHLKREDKLEILLRIWKQKQGSLANADALYELTQLIGDRKLVEQMQRANLLGRKIRV